jgi:hypothetical protein
MVDRARQVEALEDMVLTLLDSKSVGEGAVRETVEDLGRKFFSGLSGDDFAVIADRMLERLAIQLELGVAVVADDHVAWLQERKQNIAWKRWGAYRKLLLRQGRALRVLDRLGDATDEILDLAGDPAAPGAWQRRGLVIGEVQSGKTSTYIGLIDKAADAGYRLFIIIGGHTESLRRQTQARVDEGFVGRDSAFMSKELRHLVDQKLVGVGAIDPDIRAYGFTTVSSDFSVKSAQALNFEVSPSMSEPVILVVKKNTKILKNLREWLSGQAPAGGHKMPLMLLDDEADYASINTREEEDPTAVNNAIRELLALSQRSSYVGFTATPFANVLIDDSNDEDLFPRDFIFTLESPSNYVGADAVFSGEIADSIIRSPQDASVEFPFKHRSELIVERLPDSLRDAMAAFIVANAIRDLRGDEAEPRSMLINVSRFNRVQAQVHELVEEQLEEFRNAIEFDLHSGSLSPSIQRLYDIFDTEFDTSEFTWDGIRAALPRAVESMGALLVNSRTNSADTYSNIAAAGRTRIVATGGAVLSRGLTLNGLMISYFYQQSRASDTLMQMGRWFGYRDGYGDLCRLWIDEEVASWYSFVAESSRELREDLREMRRLGLTPKDFGLKVRKHPESLLVTAANKSKAAQEVSRTVSLRDKTLETPKILDNPALIKGNFTSARKFLNASVAAGESVESRQNSVIIRGVPKGLVAEFISDYGSAPSDLFFAGKTSMSGKSSFAAYVRSAVDADLKNWDVVVIGGREPTVDKVADFDVHRVGRSVRVRNGGLLISGSSRRVAGSADLAVLLDERARDGLKKEWGTSTPRERYFRALLARPAMLLYLIEPIWNENDAAASSYADKSESAGLPLVALKAAFPIDPAGLEHEARSDSGPIYLINAVLQRDWLQELAMDLDDADREDLDE